MSLADFPLLSLTSRSAPASMRRRIETLLPLTTAQWSGVRPEASRFVTEAPCRRRRSTEMASPAGERHARVSDKSWHEERGYWVARTLVSGPHERSVTVRVFGVDSNWLVKTEEQRHDLKMKRELLSVSWSEVSCGEGCAPWTSA